MYFTLFLFILPSAFYPWIICSVCSSIRLLRLYSRPSILPSAIPTIYPSVKYLFCSHIQSSITTVLSSFIVFVFPSIYQSNLPFTHSSVQLPFSLASPSPNTPHQVNVPCLRSKSCRDVILHPNHPSVGSHVRLCLRLKRSLGRNPSILFFSIQSNLPSAGPYALRRIRLHLKRLLRRNCE